MPEPLSSSYLLFEPLGISITARKWPGRSSPSTAGVTSCQGWIMARSISPACYPLRMLSLDFGNCTAERVGPHGIDPARLAPGGEAAAAAANLARRLAQTRGTGWER